jgi:hypothetical protein
MIGAEASANQTRRTTAGTVEISEESMETKVRS